MDIRQMTKSELRQLIDELAHEFTVNPEEAFKKGHDLYFNRRGERRVLFPKQTKKYFQSDGDIPLPYNLMLVTIAELEKKLIPQDTMRKEGKHYFKKTATELLGIVTALKFVFKQKVGDMSYFLDGYNVSMQHVYVPMVGDQYKDEIVPMIGYTHYSFSRERWPFLQRNSIAEKNFMNLSQGAASKLHKRQMYASIEDSQDRVHIVSRQL